MFNRGKKRPVSRVDAVDPAFEPWEPSRPIPLFLIAVFFALAVWGSVHYLGDLMPERVSKNEAGLPNIVAGSSQSMPDADAPLLVSQGSGSVWSCASCHGDQGQGAGQTPQLAGLSQAYIIKQLQDFASGSRSNESMRYVATQLTAPQMNELADYYARLAIPVAQAAEPGKDIERGRALNLHGDWKQDIPACVTCHGESAEGLGPMFPRLAGQQPEYLFSQLVAFKGGMRQNSPLSLMDDIANRMSTEDMWAVSQYFGALRQQEAN